MNKYLRITTTIYSLIVMFFSLLLMYAIIDDGIFADILSPLASIVTNSQTRIIYIVVLVTFFISGFLSVYYILRSGRVYRTKLRRTEVGSVDIGADALESIALNSAKSAQSGIKTCRARITSAKNGAISVTINAVLYSNVEIPSSMSKVQDRIKKDIERYTGIVVTSVYVKVTKVEAFAAKVESR